MVNQTEALRLEDREQGDIAPATGAHRIERELPTHCDLVINTDALTADEAADIIVAAARRRA